MSAALAQRKRWAKGNFQIFLRKKRSMVDPEWQPPHVELPQPRKYSRFMRWVFYMNLTVYPIGSFPALFFFYVTGYFLYSGNAPIYTSGLRLLMALVPKIVAQSVLSALSNRTVENGDVLRSQQTWFSYAFVHTLAVFEAIYWKITDKEATWANTGALGGNSTMELPNLLVFFTMVFGVFWAVVRFFTGLQQRRDHTRHAAFVCVHLLGHVHGQSAGSHGAHESADVLWLEPQESHGPRQHRGQLFAGDRAGRAVLLGVRRDAQPRHLWINKAKYYSSYTHIHRPLRSMRKQRRVFCVSSAFCNIHGRLAGRGKLYRKITTTLHNQRLDVELGGVCWVSLLFLSDDARSRTHRKCKYIEIRSDVGVQYSRYTHRMIEGY